MDDPNKLHHIFGRPRHGLDNLVRRYGGEEAAGEAIYGAARAALESGSLRVNTVRYYRQVFDVAGIRVTVSGRAVSGIARIGTAFIDPKTG
jgi:hypothetical protein